MISARAATCSVSQQARLSCSGQGAATGARELSGHGRDRQGRAQARHRRAHRAVQRLRRFLAARRAEEDPHEFRALVRRCRGGCDKLLAALEPPAN